MASAPDNEPKKPLSVFIQDFVDVDVPASAVGERLAAGGAWLAPLASAAGGDATSLFVRIGPQGLGDFVARTVLVRLGRPNARVGDVVMVPIRWEDSQRPALFPVLDGDLEVAPLGGDRCRVVLYASYRPPMRTVGRVLDDALLHRVAESTVRSFLQRAANALAAPTAHTDPTAPMAAVALGAPAGLAAPGAPGAPAAPGGEE